MKLQIFQLPSLKTKVVMMTLGVFVISIWLIASYISSRMREDIEGILGDQQLATVSLAAAELNSDFQDRWDALQLVAKSLDADVLNKPASVQQLVEQRPVLLVLFNAGIFITRPDGTAIAEVPQIGRVGLNYMDRDHIALALTQGKPAIGKPVIGKRVRAPSFAMTVPIRDTQGRVVGALSGATDLSKPNFLGNINTGRYGKKGGYFIVDAAHRLVVTATDQTRVMAALRPPGENPVMDRRLQGFDGPAINVNALGVEILSSAGRIPAAGWFLVATLPTQEGFAPVHTMQKHLLEVTALITALACCVVWLMLSRFLQRQFAPMISATRELDQLADKPTAWHPLPVTSLDEVGALVGAFNRLMINLGQRVDSLKRTEATLRESEERSTLAQEGARVGVWEWDIAKGRNYWSPTYESLYGLEPGTLRDADQWRQFVHPQDLPLIDAQWTDTIARGEPFEVEFRYQRTAGELRWMMTKGRAQYDAQGKPVRIVGINIDVTARKLAELELKKSEQLLRESQKAARIGSYINTLDAGTFESTTTLDDIFGITSDYPHTNEGWVKFIHPDFMQAMHEALLESINNKKPFDAEYKIIRPSDGVERWMHGRGEIAFDCNGKALSLIGTVQDITERKLKDERLLANMAEIQLREQALSQISQGVLIAGADRLTTYVNDEFVRITGYSREEMLGKPCSILQGSATQPEVVLQIRAALDAKQLFHGEILNYRKDGTPFWNDLSINPVFDSAGEVTQFVGVQRDVTERKKTLEDLHLFRKCIDRANDVIVITEAEPFDLPGPRIVFVNDAYERTTGYTREEALGGTPRMLQGAKTDPATIKRMGQALRQWKPVREEVLNYTKDGREFWSEIDIAPMANEAGWYTHWISIQRDITGRKLAEEAQRIASVAFESQQAMFITDPKQVILRINNAFTRITGYTAAEAVGQTPRLLSSGKHDADFYRGMWECVARTGQWQGEIWNRRKNGTVYPQQLNISTVMDEEGLLTHYVATFRDVTSVKAAEEQIENLAFFDLLTGLPNRRKLIIQLQQDMIAGEDQNRLGALLLIDLDSFKNLNDALGHEQGDLLLQQFAGRLSTCAREGETVARIGGDEFVLLLKPLDQDTQSAVARAETAARRLLDALKQPFAVRGKEPSCSASIGVSLFGDHVEPAAEPLKRAELAMYEAKAKGRNMLRFFDPGMQDIVNARIAMQAGLLEAIEKAQFVLHYQPQVTQDGQITGAEALLRWPDPKRGMVSPAEFIPLAEETGLILPIGNWVLETACKQLVLWESQPRLSQLTLAVNVSARQFQQRNFVDQVLATVKRTGAKAHRLELELTESMLVTDVQSVIGKMNALKARGVSFALDDFGTGYSSLSYLKRLPLDQLKIDQGFVRDILVDPDDAAIARTVVTLADSLGMSVIAEGVETAAQRELLAGMGCRQYQGYLFSRPLPIEDFEALVERGVSS